MADIVAYIGLDWGDERHSVHLQTADGTIEHVELEQIHARRWSRCRTTRSSSNWESAGSSFVTNRLTSLLKQYFLQALEWVGDLASLQGCDLLTQWPNLAALQEARPSSIRKFYQAHNCRAAAVIEARLAAIKTAQSLTSDPAIVEPLSLAVQAYTTQLRRPDVR